MKLLPVYIILTLIVVWVFFVFYKKSQMPSRQFVLSNGIENQAVIFKKSKELPKKQTEYVYYFHLKSVSDSLSFIQKVPKSVYLKANVGDQYTIVYLEKNPTFAVIK